MLRATVRSDNFRTMRTLIPVLLLSLPCAAIAAAQSPPSIGAPTLAEVAKKNQEARGKDGKPAKVFTNDDLKPVVAPPPPDPPASTPASNASPASPSADAAPADSAQTPAAAADAKPAETRDRAYWSKRIAADRSKLEQDRVLADAMQSRINALNADFVNRDDPAQRSKVASDRQRAMSELDRLKKAIADDQKAIAATEEEARRSNVPAGWLR